MRQTLHHLNDQFQFLSFAQFVLCCGSYEKTSAPQPEALTIGLVADGPCCLGSSNAVTTPPRRLAHSGAQATRWVLPYCLGSAGGQIDVSKA